MHFAIILKLKASRKKFGRIFSSQSILPLGWPDLCTPVNISCELPAKLDSVLLIFFYWPNLPLILNIQVSDFGLIVLHTTPVNANSLGYYFDQKFVNYQRYSRENSGIIGTIAGDDTLLLIIQNKAKIETVLQLPGTEFPYLNINEFSAWNWVELKPAGSLLGFIDLDRFGQHLN